MKISGNTFQRGTKDTSDVGTNQKPIAIARKFWKYNPNGHKALASVYRNGRAEAVKRHIFGHLEGSPLPNIVVYDGDDEASQAVTGLVFKSGTGARIGEGSRIFWERTKEITRLDAAMASTTTSGAVNRNFGRGDSGDLLKRGDIGHIISPAMYQAFTTGDGPTGQAVWKEFALTEMSYPVKLSYVEAGEDSYIGDPWIMAQDDNMQMAKTQRENELLFGGKVDDSSTYTHPISASQGLDNYVSTNVYSMPNPNRFDILDIMAEHKSQWAMNGFEVWGSFAFKQLLSEIAMDVSTITIPITGQSGDDGKIGLSVSTIKTSVGEFVVNDIHILGQTERLMGKAFLVPFDEMGKLKIAYRWLQHFKDLSLKWYPINRDEVHAVEGELYGVEGYEFFEEETFAKIEDMVFA